MTGSQKKRTWLIFVLLLISGVVLAPTFIKEGLPRSWPSKAIKLGLDLKGGIYLVLGVETHEAVKSRLASIANVTKAELRKQKVGIIRARQKNGRELSITLLSSESADSFAKLTNYFTENYPFLTQSGKTESGRRTTLTYRISDEEAAAIEKRSVEQAIETIRNRVDDYGVSEPVIQRSGEKRIVVQLPDVTDIDTVKKTIGSVAKLEFRLVAQSPSGSSVVGAATFPLRDGGTISLEEEVLMTGDSIDRAFVDINSSVNEAQVSLQFDSVGAKNFDNITSQNINRQLAIVLDGKVQSSPVIRERIGGGRAQISGGFSPDEAHLLALVLRAGALPAPLTFLEERTVGATLGTDSIRKGILALMIGSVMVIIFTVFYYKRAGVLAVTSLLMNVVFLLALLAILGATLTLPGIAGLVLTIGMAVDANVIIFERIREELRRGGTARAAVDGGFLNAHSTIVDANITTFITGLILYGFGSGPIKGFAVTLCCGILTSVFCALFISRVGFNVFKLRDRSGNLSI